MFTVTSGRSSQTITHRDIAKSARGAQEEVTLDTEDHSQEMGFAERVSDSLLHGKLKETTLRQIHGLSWHSTSLHIEFEKPFDKRSQKSVSTHVAEISDTQQTKKELTSGDVIEIGRNGSETLIGKDSYLIHRTPNKITPTGIALYKADEQTTEILAVKTASYIHPNDIPAIRASGKLRCGGQKYTIHFDHNNRPTVFADDVEQDWVSVTHRLLELYLKFPERFALPKGADETGEIVMSTYDVDSTTGAKRIETSPERIPTFATPNKIRITDFPKIRLCEKLRCSGIIYPVRFHIDIEPILIFETRDSNAKEIQFRLTEMWIARRAIGAKDQLTTMKAANEDLAIRAMVAVLREIQLKTAFDKMKKNRETSWPALGNYVEQLFKESVRYFQKHLQIEKAGLVEVFSRLEAGEFPESEQRQILADNLKKIAGIAVKQDNVNGNVDQIREIYFGLFSLAATCNSSELRALLQRRITKFNNCLSDFANEKSRTTEVDFVFNTVLINQKTFIAQFRDAHLSNCIELLHTSKIILEGGAKVPFNKTKLATRLIELLGDPAAPWKQIEQTIKTQRADYAILESGLVYQLGAGREIRNSFQSMIVIFGAGAAPITGRSVYTTEIYSRIVSLKQICNELFDDNLILRKQEVDKRRHEAHTHQKYIQLETDMLQEKSKTLFHMRHRMYEPLTNPNGTLMNHNQWMKYQETLKNELAD